jgi:hypothetical protein
VAIMSSTVTRAVALAALVLIALGAVSIIMGFSYKWPNAQPCGAIFFVGGCLLAGLAWIAWLLQRILAASGPAPSSSATA